MPRFLIEIEHDPAPLACIQAADALLRTGSHFLTHADWGCRDGVHKAWVIAELGTKTEALQMVPADFRMRARATQLNGFTLAEVEELQRVHAGRGPGT